MFLCIKDLIDFFIEFSVLAQIILGLMTVVLSALTLYIAYKANQAIIKHTTKKKQAEKISELASFLNTLKFHIIEFQATGGSGYTNQLNIFEIASLPTDDPRAYVNYDDYPVLIDAKSNFGINFQKYVDEVFIPKEIADLIEVFAINQTEEIDYKKLSIYHLVLSDKPKGYQFPDKLYKSNGTAYKSWLSFKKSCVALSQGIKRWFDNQGLHDVNIRTDYKNFINTDE